MRVRCPVGRSFTEIIVRHIIVIGGSAGAFAPLQQVLSGLPAGLCASVFVVLHTRASDDSHLAGVLQRSTALRVVDVIDGATIEPGCLYVARPDLHLLLEDGRVWAPHGPRENRHRPAIDPLFRSAAYAYGAAVTGVVMSGCLDDGTAGAWAIKHRGGRILVQHPDSAEYASMPESALQHVTADAILHSCDIARTLVRWTQELQAQEDRAAADDSPKPKAMNIEKSIALGSNALTAGVLELGPPTLFTCPECGGVLGRVNEGAVIRFRCHTGHAYTVHTLLDESLHASEDGLYAALRLLEASLLLITTLVTEHPNTSKGGMLGTQRRRLELQIAQLRELLQASFSDALGRSGTTV